MKPLLKYTPAVFLFIALFYIFGSYSACYREQWQTFYYDSNYICETYCHVGGMTTLLGDFITQFFTTPLAANCIMAVLLTAITLIGASSIHRISNSEILMPLALLAPSFLALLTFDKYWNMGGTMAYLLMSIAYAIHISISNRYARLAYDSVSTLLLFILGGAVALPYSILVIVAEKGNIRNTLLFLLPLALLFIASCIAIRTGVFGDWSQALTPQIYYNHGVETPHLIWMPWIVIIIATAASRVMSVTDTSRFSSKNINIATLVVSACSLTITTVSFSKRIVKSDELFKEYSTLARFKDWDGIIKKCGGQPSEYVYIQNIINEAWAEKKLLGEHLLDDPQVNITSLLMGEISDSYIATQLSDIYYSMGHIALSQFYAFEANEHIGQMSPRLLMRLAETNMIFGEVEVAKKYLGYLRQTLFYKRWAEKHLKMLDNNVLSLELQSKSQCITQINHLREGYVELNDLMEIARYNPSHATTAQYLVAMSIFIGTEEGYKPMVNELCHINALPTTLPSHFQRIYSMIK